MQRRIFTTTAAGLLAVGLVFGGIAGASRGAQPTMSQKLWRKTANDICKEGKTLTEEAASTAFAGVPKDGQPSIEQMAAYVDLIKPIVQQQITAIDALKEPTALKKKVAKLVKAAQSELDALVADPNRGFEGDPLATTHLLSGKLGLKSCAS